MIDRFPDADIIGFTTYPGLVFASPDDIPDDYYRRLGDLAGGRPIAFTEMGWQAGGDFGPYSGTPESQARFVERFGELTERTDVAFVVWSFLFDQAVPAPFDTMGLIAADGTPRPAWERWSEVLGLRREAQPLRRIGFVDGPDAGEPLGDHGEPVVTARTGRDRGWCGRPPSGRPGR